MEKLRKIQEECALCTRYRRKKIKVGPLISEERSVTEIKKLKERINIQRSIIDMMNEFLKMVMEFVMKSEHSEEI